MRTPDSPVARPREFVTAAARDLRRSRALARAIAGRDLRGQQRRSLTGAAGVILPVLVMTAGGLGFQRAGILTTGIEGMPFLLFVLAGAILWTTFTDALYAPVYGLLIEQRLLARTNAPVEAIVLAKLGPVAVHTALRLSLLVAAMIVMGHRVPATIVLAPIGMAALIVLGTAIGLFLGPINIVYRDVSRLLVPITTVGMFLCPVFYAVPDRGTLSAVMQLNPITPLLDVSRALAITGGAAGAAGAVEALWVSLALLVMAWAFLRVALPIALERASD